MAHADRRQFLKLVWAAVAAGPVLRAAPEPASARLQLLPNGRAVLHWLTTQSGGGTLEWRIGGGAWNSTGLTERALSPADTGLDAPLHVVTANITGLPDEATITYRVSWNGAASGTESVFQTPGPDGQHLTFLVVGDSGTGGAEQYAIASRMASEPDTAFVLHTGDLAYPAGSYADLRDGYLRPYSALMGRAAFFPCPGNHEYYTQSVRPYLNLRMGASGDLTYYAMRYGPVHLVSVDSNDPLMAPAAENKMLAWLEKELAESPCFWRIVIYHHPPYTAGLHRDDSFVRLSRERLAPLMEKYSVPVVFNGHEHLYQRTLPVRDGLIAEDGRGTVYVTSGGGGAGLYPYLPHGLSGRGVSAHHYLKGRIEGGRMTLAALGINGEELDFVQIAPRPALAAIVNAADHTPRLAPGSLALVRGAHLTMDRKALLFENEHRVKVLDALPGRLEFQVPEELSGVLRLRVETANGTGFLEAPLAETAPALFPLDGHPPVEPGATAAVHATGLGRWAPGEGCAWVSMALNGVEMELNSAPEPTASPGVYRISFQVPEALPDGQVEVHVRAGGAWSGPARLAVARAALTT